MVDYVSTWTQKKTYHTTWQASPTYLGKEVNMKKSNTAEAVFLDLVVMLGLFDEVIDAMATRIETLEGNPSAEADEVIASVSAAINALEGI